MNAISQEKKRQFRLDVDGDWDQQDNDQRAADFNYDPANSKRSPNNRSESKS